MKKFINGSIRSATVEDAPLLTQIAFASKQHWRYPEQYFRIWRDELTITEQYISDAKVFLNESDGVPIAFASLSEWKNDVMIKGEVLPAGMWLEHIFVEPAFMLNGVGTALFNFCVDYVHSHAGECIRILSDPNASGFYTRLGCNLVKEVPSSIEGRTTPLFEYRLTQ